MENRLKVIKERLSNTTYGHWKVYLSNEGTLIGTEYNHPQLLQPAPVITMSTAMEEPKKRIYIDDEDAEFIANSKADIEWLIKEFELMKKSLEEIAFDVKKEKEDCEKKMYDFIDIAKKGLGF